MDAPRYLQQTGQAGSTVAASADGIGWREVGNRNLVSLPSEGPTAVVLPADGDGNWIGPRRDHAWITVPPSEPPSSCPFVETGAG